MATMLILKSLMAVQIAKRKNKRKKNCTYRDQEREKRDERENGKIGSARTRIPAVVAEPQ